MPALIRSSCLLVALLGAAAFVALAGPAAAEQVSREQDIVGLRLGQKILVDDGSCPAGQIKEVTGTNLTAAGVARTQRCVPRFAKR